MLKRPHDFSEVIGHEVYKRYFIERIRKGNLPQFIILNGPEGLGKTSLADILAITINYGFDNTPEKRKAIAEVIDKQHSIDCIKKYNMAKDSGKDTAKEVLAELSPTMSSTGKKVVMCDECHAILDAAQDVFLVETEFIPKNTYLIMMTTDLSRLKATLQSRAFIANLNQLSTAEMVKVLREETERRNLTIQGGEPVLRMIAEWADNKPRAALNILNAFGTNEIVNTDVVREFIGYMSLDEIMPLITSLNGSMTFGLTYISDMRLSDNLVDSLVEVLRIKLGQPSYKVSLEEYQRARRKLEGVQEESIMKFLHKVAGLPKLTRAGLISAYMYAHSSYERLFKDDTSILQEEEAQKLQNRELAPAVTATRFSQAPSIESLLSNSAIVEEGAKI